jgi:hypothetical protein
LQGFEEMLPDSRPAAFFFTINSPPTVAKQGEFGYNSKV